MKRALFLVMALCLGSCDSAGNLTASGVSYPVNFNGSNQICILFTSGSLSKSLGQVSCHVSGSGTSVILANNNHTYSCTFTDTGSGFYVSDTFTWTCTQLT
jgi:hypothetical protein